METYDMDAAEEAVAPGIAPDRGGALHLDGWIWAALALTLIALLALALRLVDLQASLWSDEIRTHEGAVLPFARIWLHRPYPLYYLFAHGALFFGDTEALLRLPSVLAGIAGVLAMYGCGKAFAGRTAGLIAALLLAVWPYHIHHSREARFYALLMVAGVLLLWMLCRAAQRGGWGNWALAAGATAAASITHLFALPFVAAMYAGALVWLLAARGLDSPTRRRQLKAWLAAGVIGAAPFLAVNLGRGGLPTHLLRLAPPAQTVPEAAESPASAAEPPQAMSGADPPAPEGTRLTLRLYGRFFARFFEYQPPAVAVFIAIVAAGGLIWLWFRKRAAAAMVSALLILPPLPFFVTTTEHAFFDSRYFSILLPVLLMLAAVGIARAAFGTGAWLARRTRIVTEPAAAVMAVALLLVVAPSVYAGIRAEYGRRAHDLWMGDWKGAAAYMAEYLHPGDVMIHAIPEERRWEIAYPMEFYLHRSTSNSDVAVHSLQYFHSVPEAVQLVEVLDQFRERNIWVISKGVRDLSAPLIELLDQAAAERRTFGVVRVWQFGEPTQNLAPWGGFEGATADGLAGGPVSLTGPEEALSGERALRLRLDEREFVQLLFPFSAENDGLALRPGETYTLSFWTRHDGIPAHKAAPIGLAGHDAQGAPFSWVFVHLGDSGAWRRHVLHIRPGDNVPEAVRDLALLVGIYERGGTLWLDNVQLERKMHPTLFADGERGSAITRVEAR